MTFSTCILTRRNSVENVTVTNITKAFDLGLALPIEAEIKRRAINDTNTPNPHQRLINELKSVIRTLKGIYKDAII